MEQLRKSYQTAAIVAAAVTASTVMYALVAELVARAGFTPPLSSAAANVIKFAFYIAAASSYVTVRAADRVFGAKRPDPASALKALVTQAVVRAALCEMPAILGLVLFLLTGLRADLYMLLSVAVALELWHFPRLSRWEERLRADFGQLPQ